MNFTAISLEIFRSFARFPQDVNYDKPIMRACIRTHAHICTAKRLVIAQVGNGVIRTAPRAPSPTYLHLLSAS